MTNAKYKVIRTLRCQNDNIPGTLGKLATIIGQYGAEIGNIETLYLGHHYTVRDIDVLVDSEEHLKKITDSIAELEKVSVLQIMDDVLEFHKNGKIKVMSTVNINSLDDLQMVYTPGVAEVCNLILEQPGWKDNYTSIPYSIAIVTDGTAILGLGDIGSVAGMPVMEGKAALLQQLVGISGIPILLDTKNPDEIVETIKRIAPTFGGIQLEDISSPRCFLIEDRLNKELGIPVMHDDQHGTAVVTLAALINACRISRVVLDEAKIGLIGLGAAGLSIGKLLFRFTGNPVLGTATTEASIRRHTGQGGIPSSFEDIMRTSDIVIATTGVSGLISPNMIKKGQIIFALSNPHPEITPELATKSGAVVAVDGKMVNNLMSYPGIWRGALDAKATKINYEMYRAAALAIVDNTNEGALIPNPLDPKLHLSVAHNVAKAAVDTTIAQRKLDEDYFENTDITKPPWV